MKVKINETEYPATISGKIVDAEWDGRQSKTIYLEMTHEEAVSLFIDGAQWFIMDEENEYDNSEYNVAGDITDHRDGYLSVKMGKSTDLEEILELLYGGE